MEQNNNNNINNSTMATNISSNSSCPWLEVFRDRESALIARWKKGGIFVDSDLEDINCYWFQFDPVPLTSHLILAFIFFAVSGIGSASNALVFYIMATSRHLRTPVNIIIANLALSDFIMLVKMPIFIYNSLVQGPALGYRGCEIYGFFSGIAGCSSIMSLAAIAFDRYLVINRPYKGNTNSKPSLVRSYITVVCIWLYSGVISSLPLFGIGKYVPEGYLTSCSFDYLSDDSTTQTFIFVFFVVAWVVPVFIIIGSYSAVLLYVSQNRHLVSRAVEIISGAAAAEQQLDVIQEGHPQESRAARRQRKAAKFEMIIAKVTAKLVALWMVSWTPYAIVALLGITGHQNLLTPGIAMLPALFAKSSASINPFVFSLNHPKIRKEMLRRFRCVSAYNTHSTASAAAENNRMDAVGNGANGHPAANNQQDPLGSPLLHFRSRVFSSRTDCSSPSEPMTSRHYPSRAISSSFFGYSAPTGNAYSTPWSDDVGDAANASACNSTGLAVRPKKSLTLSTRQPSSESTTSVRIEMHPNSINRDVLQEHHYSRSSSKKKSSRSRKSFDRNTAVQFHSAGHLPTVTLGHNGDIANLNHVDEIHIDGI